jgi:hypothetical protein
MNLNTTILALLGKAQKNTLPKFWSSNRLYKFGDPKQKKEPKKGPPSPKYYTLP